MVVYILSAAAIVLSLAAFALYARTRRTDTLIMLLGVALAWFAVALGAFGPKTTERILPERIQESMLGALVEIQQPLAIVEPLLIVGVMLFVAGFVHLALRVGRDGST